MKFLLARSDATSNDPIAASNSLGSLPQLFYQPFLEDPPHLLVIRLAVQNLQRACMPWTRKLRQKLGKGANDARNFLHPGPIAGETPPSRNRSLLRTGRHQRKCLSVTGSTAARCNRSLRRKSECSLAARGVLLNGVPEDLSDTNASSLRIIDS